MNESKESSYQQLPSAVVATKSETVHRVYRDKNVLL